MLKPGDFIIILKETEITNSDGHPFTRNPGELYEVVNYPALKGRACEEKWSPPTDPRV